MKRRQDGHIGLREKETPRAFSCRERFHHKGEIELSEDVQTKLGSLSRD